MSVRTAALRTEIFAIGKAVIKPPDAEMQAVTKRQDVSFLYMNVSVKKVGCLD